MGGAPLPPKRLVGRKRIQHPRDLACVKWLDAASQDMFQQMQRRISKRILPAEKMEVHSRNRKPDAPAPEVFDTRSGQPLKAVVPKLIMQLDRERDFGVEEVSAPLPSSLADERREMVR